MTVDVDTVTVPTAINGKAGVALPVNPAAELAAPPPTTSGPPPVPVLSSRTLLDEHLASRPTTDLPAIFFAATNVEETLYLNQAGDRVFGRPEEGAVNSDTPVELFSQTKVVTCVSVLLLVDRGLISLDDPADIEKYLPELSTCQILTGYDEAGDGVLVPPERKITARMLCSHSSGLIYPRGVSLISDYCTRHSIPTTFSHPGGAEVLVAPLIYEPGSSFHYSQSIDWAGVLVERVSGMNLHDYMRKYIWDPLGAASMTFWPTEQVRQSKIWVCTRDEETNEIQLFPNGFALARPETVAEQEKSLLLGGGGLFGSQKDYLAFLRALLRSDPRYGAQDPLLSPAMYAELFTPTITPKGAEVLCDMVNSWIPVEPLHTPETVNHSVGFALCLVDVPGRRRKGTGYWGGAAKTNYWIDPARGIAGIVGTNLYWKGTKDPWEEYAAEFERRLYASIT